MDHSRGVTAPVETSSLGVGHLQVRRREGPLPHQLPQDISHVTQPAEPQTAVHRPGGEQQWGAGSGGEG